MTGFIIVAVEKGHFQPNRKVIWISVELRDQFQKLAGSLEADRVRQAQGAGNCVPNYGGIDPFGGEGDEDIVPADAAFQIVLVIVE